MPTPRPPRARLAGLLAVVLVLLAPPPAVAALRRLEFGPVGPVPAPPRDGQPTPSTAPPPLAPPAPPPTAAQPPAVAPVGGRVRRPFAAPATPYGPGHRGVDLGAAPGEVVRAALPGTVTFAGEVAGRSWVTIAHGDGLRTTYGGLRPAVTAGLRVGLGDPLGRATGGTLDWGARRDRTYVDPLGLLGTGRVRLVPVVPAPRSG